MIEIKEKQYDELRKQGDKYCGRVYSWKRKEVVIYFQMEDCDANMKPLQILKELAIGHPIVEGKYDVSCHWAYPEVVNVNYKVS